MKKSITLALSIVSLICFSCEETHCPGFQVDKTKLLPYHKGQDINFTSGNETMYFTIDSVYYSAPYSIGTNSKGGCDIVQAYISSSINRKYDMSFEHRVKLFHKDTAFNLNVAWYRYWEPGNEESYGAYYQEQFNFKKIDTTDKNNIYPYL